MKKSLLTLIILSLAMGLVSCGKTKKLKDATDMLAITFAGSGYHPLQDYGFHADSMYFDEKDVIIKVSLDKTMPSIPDFNFDKWIKPFITSSLLGDAISNFTLGTTLKTEKGKSPVDDFLDLMKESNAQFKVELNTWDGTKSYEITPDEAKEILDMSREDFCIYNASSAFIAQYKSFLGHQWVKSIKIEDNKCCIELENADEAQFISELKSMPTIVGYAVLNDLELKINDTIIQKDQLKQVWEEAKQMVLKSPKEDNKDDAEKV